MEARLQRQQVAHRHREALGDADAAVLRRDDLIHRLRDRLPRVRTGLEAPLRGGRDRPEQQHGEQEHRRHRPVLGHPPVGVRETRADQAQRQAVLLAREMRRGRREQVRDQSVLLQQVEGAHTEARHEQLLELVEQARRRNVLEQPRERRKRRARALVQREAELGLEAHGAQHPHRILAVARLGIADQAQRARTDVGDAAGEIPDREVLDVVVERVAGEVAAPDVLVDRAVDVVAQQPTAMIVHEIGVRARRRPVADVVVRIIPGVHVAIHVAELVDALVGADRFVRLGIAVVVRLRIRRDRLAGGTEGRHLDDLLAEADVREPEAPADQAAVAEQPPDLLGRGIGRDVEVLGFPADQAGPGRSRPPGNPGSRRPSGGRAPSRRCWRSSSARSGGPRVRRLPGLDPGRWAGSRKWVRLRSSDGPI